MSDSRTEAEVTLFTDGLETQPYSGWLRDLYLCFAGAAPPEHLLVPPDEIGDAAVELQDWCCQHVSLGWMTGIGLMEACWAQMDEAIGNANLRGIGATTPATGGRHE